MHDLVEENRATGRSGDPQRAEGVGPSRELAVLQEGRVTKADDPASRTGNPFLRGPAATSQPPAATNRPMARASVALSTRVPPRITSVPSAGSRTEANGLRIWLTA